MSFIQELNEVINKNPDAFGKDQEQFMHKTGFDCFDYLNGMSSITDQGEKRLSLGIDAGKIIMVIGKSGSGKSTLAIQFAHNIIKKYDEGCMFVYDFEQSNTKERIRMVTGMTEEYFNKHVSIKKVGISAEQVLSLALQIKELKLKQADKLMTPNKEGILDEDGNPILILPPTVIILDSLAACLPKAQLNEEIGGQMAATAMAKTNTTLFKHLTQVCAEANIIPIVINHITQKVNISMMPTQTQVNYLKQDENLPGGLGPIYLTSTLVKITTSTKLEEDKGYGIKGFEAKVELIKSRTAPAGKFMMMVYNQREGFDNDYSLLEYLKGAGKVLGNGRAYRLEGLEDITFRASNFKEVLAENETFREYFYSLGRSELEKSIVDSSRYQLPVKEEPVVEENISDDHDTEDDPEIEEMFTDGE